MQRKIFIGVSLPGEVKKRLMRKIEKWEDLPIRWSSEENLHLTLAFLGHVDDDLIMGICDGVRDAVSGVDMFDVSLDKIELGPIRDENANLVWFTGEASDDLKRLVENIEKELGIFRSEKKSFRPHITLGRIRKHKWEKLEEKPDIAEDFSVLLPIESVQIFESAEIEGKRKFSVIDSHELKF
ncbi:MAG: RNA 2',3'-cyclic phosphodiesterase [Parcubacteria group bacterium]|jgi:2'-5' RNA ligase